MVRLKTAFTSIGFAEVVISQSPGEMCIRDRRNGCLASLDKILTLFDFCHEQGWAEGSAIQSLEHETLRSSGYCYAVFLMKKELKETGRLKRELNAMSWYINFRSIFHYQGQEVTADELSLIHIFPHLAVLPEAEPEGAPAGIV